MDLISSPRKWFSREISFCWYELYEWYHRHSFIGNILLILKLILFLAFCFQQKVTLFHLRYFKSKILKNLDRAPFSMIEIWVELQKPIIWLKLYSTTKKCQKSRKTNFFSDSHLEVQVPVLPCGRENFGRGSEREKRCNWPSRVDSTSNRCLSVRVSTAEKRSKFWSIKVKC